MLENTYYRSEEIANAYYGSEELENTYYGSEAQVLREDERMNVVEEP